MECETLLYFDNDNTVYKPKKKFETLELAIAAAKKINSKDKTITKLVAYKCNKCFKFHIGRNGKELTEKERNKFKKAINGYY